MTDIQDDEELDALARETDPITSHLAADEINPRKIVDRIWKSLALDGPQTSKEISRRTGIEFCSVSPRFIHMEKAGIVKRYGHKPNPGSKKLAIIWAIVERDK